MKKDIAIKKKARKVPHTYVILIGLVLVISLLSYIVPASTYDMMEVNGRTVVDPDTFHYVERTPVTPMQFLTAVPRGLHEAAEISFFIFILGGAFHIINATGAMEVGVGNLAKKLENVPTVLIPTFIVFFSILGGTIGMSEETIVFVPIGLILARSLGFDAIVGTSIIFLGAAVGFNSGFMNPFTVGVAQTIAELELFSAIGFRLIIWAVFNVATILYITRYAKKVRANPESSYVYELEQREKGQMLDLTSIPTLTNVHKIVVAIFVAGLVFIVYGVFKLGFYITEIASIFLAIAFFSGVAAKI
ncbi:MAG: C4-dicarboxylate ABC transporter permease, partial [Tissierellia bacterium]|nr:C4-dicarboxylate ABC transporter permease [Tissierellia bacterium]